MEDSHYSAFGTSSFHVLIIVGGSVQRLVVLFFGWKHLPLSTFHFPLLFCLFLFFCSLYISPPVFPFRFRSGRLKREHWSLNFRVLSYELASHFWVRKRCKPFLIKEAVAIFFCAFVCTVPGASGIYIMQLLISITNAGF
ncbi:uncharacterized protein [Malus domestica]|uniref:uncharacterized protein n=1 Tax=Malus domestica TaxID=3750 RepID=UPI003975934F